MTQVFVSYSHKDEAYLQKGELIDYLKSSLGNKARFWDDRGIVTGNLWDETIHKNILNSQVAILLVSNHFIESEYINSVEVHKFFTATIKKFIVFPIIVSSCDPQKIDWLKDLQYIPSEKGKSVETDFPKGAARQALYKKILDDLETQIAYVATPVISAGQSLSALVNLINAIESELLLLCGKEDLINKDHSLMFEGRSTSLYARLRQHGAPDYLQILKFEELEQRLNPLDFVKITEYDKILNELYSKWFVLEAGHSIMNSKGENDAIRVAQRKIILKMFPCLIKMLEYINKIGFDLHDHYYQIYEAMGVIDSTRAMNSL
ncbi:MAG TPA: toll/interleukin-1 receptor domain-containing protein [Panacibacter sp.]|nr:toll/interleukin-1 receptor domain-containing protein [Panacibacter sp.]HNP47054.1 toll/interleukin-1 receptor domain-containing protein [Panacibacter sp.]